MEYIRVITADWMPVTVRGMTAYYFDVDGQAYYTIFINDKLSLEMRCAAYTHEINHINNDDFHKMIPIEDLEAVRHETAR